MHFEANITGKGTTTLWIPDRFGEPVITGTNVVSSELTKVDGGYSSVVKVNGNYSIDVGF